MLDKRLPGFGELFRMLSYEEVGAAAMLSRAQMGISRAAASSSRCPARRTPAGWPSTSSCCPSSVTSSAK